MSKMSKKRKSRKQPRIVRRGDRVKPSAMAEAKKQPWRLQALLVLGRDDGGVDADQFECAVEVVDAFKAITRQLGYRPVVLSAIARTANEMSPRDDRLASTFLAWGTDLVKRFLLRPHVVVEWIEDERTMNDDDVRLLSKALDLWDKHRTETGRALRRGIDNAAREGFTSARHDP
jgi:hypothetical protein